MWGWTLLYALIHPSAWKRNSANFAITVFSKVPPQKNPSLAYKLAHLT